MCKRDKTTGAPLGIIIGVALGIVYGMLFDNLALGISIGFCFGISFSMIWEHPHISMQSMGWQTEQKLKMRTM